MADARGAARDQLKSLIERLERAKKTIADDIKDVMVEAIASRLPNPAAFAASQRNQ